MARPRPVCVECLVEMRPEKNGVYVETVTQAGEPYEIYEADMWKCPVCRKQIVEGFGYKPTLQHWQPSYASERRKLDTLITLSA